VTTSRYTALSFVPKNLVEQMRKPSNVYFLLIMFLQMVPVISISGGQPAMLPPLVCVIVISMCKDAYEDYLKHQKDREENESTARHLTFNGDSACSVEDV
jgi:phospholipid-transporting ATPase